MSALAPTLDAFFTDRLARQRQASPHTIAAYRDTFRLLLAIVHERTGRAPSSLDFSDLDAPVIGAFLTHLETERGNSVRTRNARQRAEGAVPPVGRKARTKRCVVRSEGLSCAPPQISRPPADRRGLTHRGRYPLLLPVRLVRSPRTCRTYSTRSRHPLKRFQRALVTFLDRAEIAALLEAPDRSTVVGRRDHALLLLAVQTGLRLSELTGLRIQDIHLGAGPHLRCYGKGRKERATPLTRQSVATLKVWLHERDGHPDDLLFPSRLGGRLSADAVQRLVRNYAKNAAHQQPSLRTKPVSPHVLRHTNAMQLLTSGIDSSVIALWLRHESVQTTQIYIHADLSLKERALARTAPPLTKPGRYRPPDRLLAFLVSL